MPELPEVETVRRGLTEQVAGRTVTAARFHHPRATRRHEPGGAHLQALIVGRRLVSVDRRGKYLWFVLGGQRAHSGREATDVLVAHLGMSGQFRVTEHPLHEHPHRRFDAELDDGRWLSFLDQRTFGGFVGDVLETDSTRTREIPSSLTHLAPDPFEPGYDVESVARGMRRRRTEVKRALLDQTLVSGIGNIYADEALWRARVHPQRRTEAFRQTAARGVLEAAADVMAEALVAGGTSFDQLYVNVNGDGGYFGRSLAVYGREDRPCQRCHTPIRRIAFANRSSYLCPRCQRAPRPTVV